VESFLKSGVPYKIYFHITLAVTVLLVVFGTLAGVYNWITYEQLDATNQQENLKRLEQIYHTNIQQMLATTDDWSTWDEAYNYVNNVNPSYVEKNVTAEVLTTLNMSLLAFLDSNEKVIFACQVDTKDRALHPLPFDLPFLKKESAVIRHSGARPAVTIVPFEKSLYILTAQPLVGSLRPEVPKGRVLFGRRIDDTFLARLSQQTQFKVTLRQNRTQRILPEAHHSRHPANIEKRGDIAYLHLPLYSASGEHWADLIGEAPRKTVIFGRKALCAHIILSTLFTLTTLGFLLLFLNLTKIKDAFTRSLQARHLLELARIRVEAAEMTSKAKDQFLANMSHELRTPLNAIIGMTDLTLLSSLTEQQKKYLTHVQHSSHILLNLIDDILDYTTIQTGKLKLVPGTFSIRELIEQHIAIYSVLPVHKEIKLQYHIADDIPHQVIGDASRLGQVLAKLLGNAVKFTSSGTISLKAELITKTDKAVRLRFAVQDTGIGIAPSEHHKLFTYFSQVDQSVTKKFGGSGLGLAISKKLVEAMNGEIAVESELGKGATFHFTAQFQLSSQC
jgi:signal transduction histidine kinase